MGKQDLKTWRRTRGCAGEAGGVWEVGGRVRGSVRSVRIEDDNHAKKQGRDAWAELSRV